MLWHRKLAIDTAYKSLRPITKYARAGIIKEESRSDNTVHIYPESVKTNEFVQQVQKDLETRIGLYIENVLPTVFWSRVRPVAGQICPKEGTTISDGTRYIIQELDDINTGAPLKISEFMHAEISYDKRKETITLDLTLAKEKFGGMERITITNSVEKYTIGKDPVEMEVIAYLGRQRYRVGKMVEHSFGRGWRVSDGL